MNLILRITVALAALVFISVSAAMNAVFLSSLGRNGMECVFLSSVSMASDVMKAVLPVIFVRAITLRAWAQCAITTAMLIVVVALSLASGSGFIAMARGAAQSSVLALSEKLGAAKRDLEEAEAKLAALPIGRPATVIETTLAATAADRRWSISKSCADPAVARQFCSDVFKLRVELVSATERGTLVQQRLRLRDQITALTASGAGGDAEPQVGAIADLLGIARDTLRGALTASVAVVLELGSIVLLLLLFGPALHTWREPSPPIPAVPETAQVPLQPDRKRWQQLRGNQRLGERA